MAETLFIADFTGGWNADKDPDQLAANELVVADNIDISDRGGVKKRKGLLAINSTTYGAPVTQIFEWARASGTTYLMAVIGNALYRINADGARSLVQTLKSGCENVSHFSFNDKLYFLDGNKIYVYNGSSVSPITQAGTPNISAVPASEGQTPLPKGLYRIAVTYELSGGTMVGPFAIASYNLTANDSILRWSNIPDGPIGTVAKILWRTMPNTEIFFPIGKVSQQTQYDDDVEIKGAHSSMGRTFSVSTNFDAINRCRFAVRHPKSLRIFYAGDPGNDNALFFSEPNAPEYVKGTSVLFPATDEGPITGLALFMDAVVVFFKHCAYIWRGIDPEMDAIWMRLPIADGVVAHRTICHTTNALTYLGGGGIYSLHPSVIGYNAEVELGNQVVSNITAERVGNVIKSIPVPEKCVATFDRRNRRYILAYQDLEVGGSGNNALLVFEEQFGGACVRWKPIQAHCVYARMNGEVLVGLNGYICMFDGYTDMGAPVVSHIEGQYSPATHLVRKLFTKMAIATEGAANDEYKVATLIDDQALNFDIDNAVDGFNTTRLKFRKTGKRFRLRIKHERPTDFVLYSVGVEYTPTLTYGGRA